MRHARIGRPALVYDAIICVGGIADIEGGFVPDSGWMDEEAWSVSYACMSIVLSSTSSISTSSEVEDNPTDDGSSTGICEPCYKIVSECRLNRAQGQTHRSKSCNITIFFSFSLCPFVHHCHFLLLCDRLSLRKGSSFVSFVIIARLPMEVETALGGKSILAL